LLPWGFLLANSNEATMHFSHISVVGVVAAIALQSVCPSCLMAAEDETDLWRERFRTEAPRKWQEYRTHSDRFQGSESRVCSGRVGERPTYEKYTVEFKQNRALGCVLSRFENEGNRERKTDSMPQTLWAKNSHYKFELVQSGPKGLWLLTSREPAGTQSKSAADITSFDSVMASSNHAIALKTGHDQISSLLAHPEFKVIGVTRFDKNGTALVRVDIDFRPEHEDEIKYSWLRKGWLLFDPQRYWLLVEFDGNADRYGEVGTMHGSYEYETGAGGLPILKRKLVTFKGKEADGKPVDLTYDFQFNFTEGEAPESEFYLEAYSLLDAIAVEEAALAQFQAGMQPKKGKGLPTYLWVLIGAGVCVAMACGLYYLARRRRARVA